MSVTEAAVINIPPTTPLAEVVVVPETVPGDADHI